MNENMKDYLQMGTVHFMSFPYVLSDESRIIPTLEKLIADSYFTVIEIARVKDQAIRRSVKRLFDNTDCVPIFAVQPEQLIHKLNPNAQDPSERKKAVDVIKTCVDEAYEFEAKGFGFIAGKYEIGKEDEALKILIDSCQEICDYASSLGTMPIVLEQFDFDVQNRLLIGPAGTAKRLAHALEDYSNFGILVDLSHLPLVRETPHQCLSTLGKYVKHVHIGNAVYSNPNDYLYGDYHPRFSTKNSAVNAELVADFLRELFSIGYFGEGKRPIVSFEIKAWHDDDCDEVLTECKQVMDLAWSLV